TGAYAVYQDNESNTDTYGYLYNWYAVDLETGVCPEDWRVPTDDEIKQLEMYLGMSQSEADASEWRGTNEGSKLAGNAELWDSGDLVNDAEFGTSGFTALPGGYRYYDNGFYFGMGYSAFFWSSTEYDSNGAWYRLLNYNYSEITRNFSNSKKTGLSVRCIRDLDYLTISNFHEPKDEAHRDGNSR
ncbi:MAG: fibrobacter succinogenes major paralogous domain-containing protein, partial [Dehalococcoidales bacterium]|nr:fibrobacter succinogenes major paralogous domain-containing protein [Dehalococcoidales bacterium]